MYDWHQSLQTTMPCRVMSYQVFAVSKRDTRAVYACKTMNKAKIIERRKLHARHVIVMSCSCHVMSCYVMSCDDVM